MKTTFFSQLLFVLLIGTTVFSQVGINTTTPSAKSVLDLTATDKGFLLPRMSTTQRIAIAPNATTDKGLQVFDTDTNSIWYWSGLEWKNLSIQKSYVSGFFSATTYTAGAATPLVCTETIDVNNDFDANAFTAPRTGVYLISANLTTTSKSWTSAEELSLGIGDVTFSFFSQTSWIGHAGPSLNFTVFLNSGNTISFAKWSTNGFTIHTANFNRFSISEM
jgi:hypothetical protein